MPLLVQSGAFEGPRTGSQTSTRKGRRLEFPKESAASVREAEALLTRIESCPAPLHPLRQRAVESRHSTQKGHYAYRRRAPNHRSGQVLLNGRRGGFGGGGPGFKLRQFLPPQDGSVATCLWEADSIDSLQEWLDPATAGVTENTYIAIDDENAIGLPEAAAAGA